jgi:hypothetical protein
MNVMNVVYSVLDILSSGFESTSTSFDWFKSYLKNGSSALNHSIGVPNM